MGSLFYQIQQSAGEPAEPPVMCSSSRSRKPPHYLCKQTLAPHTLCCVLSHHSIWPFCVCIQQCMCERETLTCSSSSWSPPSSRATATEAKGRLAICCRSLISCCRRHRETSCRWVGTFFKVRVTSVPPCSDGTVSEVENFDRGYSS